MLTRFDFRCPICRDVQEIKGHLGQDLAPQYCTHCNEPMEHYFGAMDSTNITINYGFRPHRYSNKTDRDIAHYQFEHL